MTLSFQIVSDVVCPWCYVGKRRLERALDMLGLRATAVIAWLPFELNPNLPVEGIERATYRERKFGRERVAEMDRRMAETGRQEGIGFAFDRMMRQPNTRRAHVLIAHASEVGRADAAVEALFRAFFEEGRDIGDLATLCAIAAEAGLDPAAAEAAMTDPEAATAVAAQERYATESGIAGVPFFVVDGRWSASGAQSTEWWVETLRRTRQAAA